MCRIVLLLVSWCVLASVINGSSFPSDVQQCQSSDTECLSTVVTNILNTQGKGHRGLNLIPFDPLHIKSLLLPKIPDSPVNVEFKFKDVDLFGISQATITKVSAFPKEPSNFAFEMMAILPKIVLTGPYSINGRVLILPITGKGNSKIVFEDATAIAKAKCSTLEKDGKTYLEILNVHLDLRPKKMSFVLENLFNGDKALGDNMNKFLNENWEQVYSEMKPIIADTISKILMHIGNGVFSKIPYTELFLPS